VKFEEKSSVKDENRRKRKPFDIKERTFEYALQAIRLFQELQAQKDSAGWIIGKQFLRSATSIGANVQEAQSGESKADFIHKYSIAPKEARESLYWLKSLDTLKIVMTGTLHSLINETNEITAIITSIIANSKNGPVK
jgi:four helix bundle protein